VKHVPNPVAAGKARMPALTLGAATDPNSQCVLKCDPKGSILVAVAKLAPQPSTAGRFYALGRVFSGTVGADKMYLLNDDHVPEYAKEAEEDEPMPDAAEADPEASPGSPSRKNKPKEAAKSSMEERRLQGVFICQAKAFNSIANVPAGNIAAFSGVDQYMLKRNTMSANKDAYPLKPPSFNVSAVVKVSVSPKEAKELPKTVEGLRRLAKSCPLVEVQMEEGGDHVVGACGGEHIRLLRKDLETDYLPGIKLEWGAPSVSYKETVTMESSMMCLSKSPNKHNRLFMKAELLDEEVCRAIESKKITPMQDAKTRGKILANEYGWDKNDTLKIWGFGPAAESADKPVGANILVDQTKGIQYLGEIKESVNSGLLWAAKQGPIAEESMRGIRFNLLDVKLHTDSIHRGMGQIQPTARRVFFASMMTAGMRLVEPVFLASIEAPTEASAGIMQALGACRGELVLSDDQGDTLSVTAYVPISETIGNTPFATVLGQKTSGKAFVSYAFDHWSTMPADPMQAGSKSYDLMIDIRKRKGLKPEPPVFSDYYDKL
jgi:elongation factor 2